MPEAIDTRKKAILLVAGVFLLLALSLTVALLLKFRPNRQTVHAEFRQEFNSFMPPPDAVSVQDNDVEPSR